MDNDGILIRNISLFFDEPILSTPIILSQDRGSLPRPGPRPRHGLPSRVPREHCLAVDSRSRLLLPLSFTENSLLGPQFDHSARQDKPSRITPLIANRCSLSSGPVKNCDKTKPDIPDDIPHENERDTRIMQNTRLMTDSPLLLAIRSWGSFLRGYQPVEDLVETSQRCGWNSVAITEVADLGTAVEATREGLKQGTQIVTGVELPFSKNDTILILPRDPGGLEELHRLVSHYHLYGEDSDGENSDGEEKRTRHPLTPEHIQDLKNCWIIVGSSKVARSFLDNDASIRSRLIIEIDRWRSSLAQERLNLDFAKDQRLQTVASSRFGGTEVLPPAQADLLDAIHLNSTVQNISSNRIRGNVDLFSPSRLAAIPTVTEWKNRYHDLPETIETAVRLGREAQTYPRNPHSTIFPPVEIAPGQTAYGVLYSRCHEGLRRRLGGIDRAALERLTRELRIIDDMGFVPYFLVVGEIVEEAQRLGMACAGRGSGAASIVSYALGITQVNPLRHSLRFERFLHEQRKDLPDIDIDLCWRGREQLIDHVYQRYGSDRTAMICTRQSLQVRSALRESARAHGVAPYEIDRLSRRLPHRSDATIQECLSDDPVLAAIGLPHREKKTITAAAQWLRGRPHHRSIHPGGICIADRPISGLVALEHATRGIVVTQLDMYSIEHTGLIKIDLLGNRCVSELGSTRDLVEIRTGRPLEIDDIPEECPKTADLLKEGRTLGCFQLESPAMRALLIQMKAENASDVIQSVALIRPGPSAGGLKDEYCRRIRGEKSPDPPHPALLELLADQQGLLLYEENVMEVIATVLKTTLTEADVLRRKMIHALKKNGVSELEKLSDQFVTRAIQQGFGVRESQKLWEHLFQFSRYSFNKSHAASYGLLAWRSAWLKTHHPAEFMCSLFRHHAGMYPFSTFVSETRRLGVPLRLPCIHRSGEDYLLEEDGGIRMPLNTILGGRDKSIHSVISARPFSSPEDFMRRTVLSCSEMEDWILTGALDCFGVPRTRLIWRTCTRRQKERSSPTTALVCDLPGIVDEGPGLTDFSPRRKLKEEIRLLGASISAHPMTLFRKEIRREKCQPISTLKKWAGKNVRIAGIRLASRQHPTKTGSMGFITLEDEEALCEVTCFPRQWSRAKSVLLERPEVLIITGRVDIRMGVLNIIAETVAPLSKKKHHKN